MVVTVRNNVAAPTMLTAIMKQANVFAKMDGEEDIVIKVKKHKATICSNKHYNLNCIYTLCVTRVNLVISIMLQGSSFIMHLHISMGIRINGHSLIIFVLDMRIL